MADAFAPLRSKSLSIGAFVYPDLDQIDLTGPFEVLVRIPKSTVHVIAGETGPLRDHMGLILTPDTTLDDAPEIDVLLIPGGPGQQALMNDEPVLAFIRNHLDAGKIVFSVCTGALICGAAGSCVDGA